MIEIFATQEWWRALNCSSGAAAIIASDHEIQSRPQNCPKGGLAAGGMPTPVLAELLG
ncbi:MAG: hypothetical protein ACKVYV_15510 [Limisphaerales bacterium]